MGARYRFVIVGVIVLLCMIGLIVAGYWFNWPWTGFGPETSEPEQHAKTLWDWLNLLGVLAIPVVVGLGTVWFTTQQGKVSNAENKDNQREVALQAYIDKMSELLLHEELRGSAEDDEVRKIARVRTLTVLRGLDALRKASVLQFLHESGLIDKNKRIIDLSEAKLSEAKLSGTNLRGADLSGADLSGADLSGANLLFTNLRGVDLSHAKLVGANLRGADLREVNLCGSDLSHAKLSGAKLFGAKLNKADLSGAALEGAILSGATLEGAILSGAKLRGATVTMEQLEKAKSLEGATMPDGSTRHDELMREL